MLSENPTPTPTKPEHTATAHLGLCILLGTEGPMWLPRSSAVRKTH